MVLPMYINGVSMTMLNYKRVIRIVPIEIAIWVASRVSPVFGQSLMEYHRSFCQEEVPLEFVKMSLINIQASTIVGYCWLHSSVNNEINKLCVAIAIHG